MADGVTTQSATPATIPASTTIATDDAGVAGHVQIVKLAVSTDGSATALTANNTDGLLVNLGSNNDVTLATLPDTAGGDLAAIKTAVQVIDNFISASRGLVTEDNSAAILTAVQTIDNFISGSRGLVTEDNSAAILTAVQLIDNFISGSRGLVTEDNSAAILTAVQLIDDYVATVASAVPAKGAAIAGTDGTNARLIKTDTSGELQVDVLTLPNVTIGAAIPAGNNNIGDVDIVTMPAVTNAGTFAVQESGAALTALQLIDDAVKTDDAAFTPATDKVLMLGAQADETTPDSVDEGDAGALRMTLARGLHVNIRDDAGDSAMDGGNNAVRVNVVAGGGTGGTSHVDDSAFTPAASNVTPIGGMLDDTTPDSVDEGDVGVVRMTATRAIHVNLRDNSGNEVSVGGGTQYTEDAAAAADPVGTALNLIRKDTPASEVSLDGDNIAARGNSAGAQYVELLSGTAKIGGDATNGLKVDITRIAAGTNNIGDVDILTIAAGDNNIGNVDIVTMPNVTNGGTFAVQESGAALTALQLIDDTVATDGSATPTKGILIAGQDGTNAQTIKTDTNGELQVDVLTMPSTAVTNVGTFAVQESGSALTALQLIDDGVATVASAITAKGMAAVGTDGTNARILKTDTGGELQIDVLSIAAGDNNIGNVDIVSGTVTTVSTVTTLTGGGVAHDSPDGATNPVKVGAKASATLSDDTMVANADRIDLTGDLDGALYVRHIPLGDVIFEAVSNTDGASTAFTNFGATASTRSYVTSVTAFRTDAGTSMAYIDFRDGTAGSVIYRVPLPPAGGVTLNNGGTPLFYTTANTALAYDVSSALTTVYISVTGFKSKARA